MSNFTLIAQSFFYNIISILYAYVKLIGSFLLKIQEIRGREDMKVLEIVLFGTPLFPWLIGTMVKYGPIMTRLEPEYRILRAMPELYEDFVWFGHGYTGNIAEHSNLKSEQCTLQLLGGSLLQKLQTTSKPPFHYICAIITVSIGIGIYDRGKLIPALILGISVWCGQPRNNTKTGQMPRHVEFVPDSSTITVTPNGKSILPRTRLKITPGDENFIGFQIVNPNQDNYNADRYFTRTRDILEADTKLTSDDTWRVLDSTRILKKCQKEWDYFISLDNRTIINEGTRDKIRLLRFPFFPSSNRRSPNGTRESDKIDLFDYDFARKVAGSFILPEWLMDAVIRDKKLITHQKYEYANLLEVQARNQWFSHIGADNPKNSWKWPTTYFVPGNKWWSTAQGINSWENDTWVKLVFSPINFTYIRTRLIRGLYDKLNENIVRILGICVAVEAVVIGGVMLGQLIPEILANTPPDFISNLPPQPPGGMVRPFRGCPVGGYIPSRPETVPLHAEKVGAAKARVGFLSEQWSQQQYDKANISPTLDSRKISAPFDVSLEPDPKTRVHLSMDQISKICDENPKKPLPTDFESLTGIEFPSEPVPWETEQETKQRVRKEIRERLLNSKGRGGELNSTGTGVEPLSSSIDCAKDDTTLAEVLSPFIDWAKEISIGDTTLAEVLSPFINWSKEISIGHNPLVEFDWAGVISLERGYYCLILIITIIILGRLWGDSITVNVTSLEPVQTTENRIITQISRILTPEVKWIISVIICLFLYYFYINRLHRRCG